MTVLVSPFAVFLMERCAFEMRVPAPLVTVPERLLAMTWAKTWVEARTQSVKTRSLENRGFRPFQFW